MPRLEETHVSNRETDQPAYPFCQTNAMVISYSDSIFAPAVPHFIHFLSSPEGRFFFAARYIQCSLLRLAFWLTISNNLNTDI